MSENNKTWSRDNEIFRHNSLAELIKHNDDLNPGDVVYAGEARTPQLNEFCDADDVIDLMKDRGCDIAGEYADDFMADITDEAKSELSELLKTWMEKHVTVDFFSVHNINEYTLSEDDLLETQQPNLHSSAN
jgi:hypothetical protein